MTNLLQPLSMSRMVEHVARELEMTSTVFSVAPGYRGGGPAAQLPFGRLDLPLGTAPALMDCWPKIWCAPMWRGHGCCPLRRWARRSRRWRWTAAACAAEGHAAGR